MAKKKTERKITSQDEGVESNAHVCHPLLLR